MCNFTHLHNHSEGSTVISHDGLGTVNRLVSAAKQKGFKVLALTDHGNLINTPSFIHACNLEGIKPISGLEAYLEQNDKNFHITLLADGNEGFNTLIDLNNIAQKNYHNKRPVFKLSDFETHNKGLLVFTGCLASPLQELDYPEAKNIGIYLKNIFGARLFAEIMFVGFNEQIERALKLAKDLKLKIVTTNDSHFPYASDAKAHEVLTSMHGGYDYNSEYLFLATPEELETRVSAIAPQFLTQFKEGLENAFLIGNKIKSVSFDKTISLPKIDNVNERLLELVSVGMSNRVSSGFSITKEVQERIEYEYQIIKDMGFASYFIILNDMVSYAKSIGVKIGAGRGSGAGSLLLYLLSITDINPLEYDLKFERFINPKRVDFPDVDIDYDSEGRYKVIEYAKKRWGAIPVATYHRYSPKSLANDLGRYFKISREEINDLKEYGFDDNDNPVEYYDNFVKNKPLFDECYKPIVNQIRHVGKHAGGVIITDKNVPTIKTTSGDIVASWTEGLHDRELSEMGIVKFDILGVSSLDVLVKLEKQHGLAPKPVDNSPVFKLFRNGDTLGIFQFTESGITEYTKRVKPDKFMDLVAINALWRPGPMQGSAPHYVEYKHNGQRLLHPLIDDILAETYGVIVYQEQFMSIYARVTDTDFGTADIARKILTKSKKGNAEWEQKFKDLEKTFINSCLNHGMSSELANQIWNEIKTHTGYSFNKSHAVSYTMLSWQLAYFKYYYRTDFYAAILSVDESKSKEYLFDVIKSGIEIVAPDINKSTDEYTSDGTKIYMPLTALFGISEAGYNAILTQRPYTTFEDFVNKVPKKKVNKRAKKALLAIGAMNTLTGDSKCLETGDLEQKTLSEIQHEYLGFTLPTQEFFKAVERANKRGLVAGVITEVEERETKVKKRKYVRYHLYPSGIVRSYNVLDLPLGKEVQFKCKHDEYGYECKSVTELEYE